MDTTEMLADFSAFVAILWPLFAAGFGVPLGMALILSVVEPFRAMMGLNRG